MAFQDAQDALGGVAVVNANGVVEMAPLGIAVHGRDPDEHAMLQGWMMVVNQVLREADEHDAAIDRLRQHPAQLTGFAQVPGNATVEHVIFHVNAAHPGASIVMLIGDPNGRVDDRAQRQAAANNHIPEGKVIFDGRLVGGYWAVTARAPDDGSVRSLSWWFHCRGTQGLEKTVDFHHNPRFSTDHVKAFGTLDLWQNDKPRQINVHLLSRPAGLRAANPADAA